MTEKANPHHLVLGTLKDFLTGKELPDTHDERYRQKIARYLVEKAGFSLEEISSNIPSTIAAGDRKASLKIDFIVRCKSRVVMLIKYAPGSLVTRRISTLALSRAAVPCQVPYVVVTNGESAEIIDGDTGKLLYEGLDTIPDRELVMKKFEEFSFKPVSEKTFNQASRIAFACEVDGACPCDSDICTVDE